MILFQNCGEGFEAASINTDPNNQMPSLIDQLPPVKPLVGLAFNLLEGKRVLRGDEIQIDILGAGKAVRNYTLEYKVEKIEGSLIHKLHNYTNNNLKIGEKINAEIFSGEERLSFMISSNSQYFIRDSYNVTLKLASLEDSDDDLTAPDEIILRIEPRPEDIVYLDDAEHLEVNEQRLRTIAGTYSGALLHHNDILSRLENGEESDLAQVTNAHYETENAGLGNWALDNMDENGTSILLGRKPILSVSSYYQIAFALHPDHDKFYIVWKEFYESQEAGLNPYNLHTKQYALPSGEVKKILAYGSYGHFAVINKNDEFISYRFETNTNQRLSASEDHIVSIIEDHKYNFGQNVRVINAKVLHSNAVILGDNNKVFFTSLRDNNSILGSLDFSMINAKAVDLKVKSGTIQVFFDDDTIKVFKSNRFIIAEHILFSEMVKSTDCPDIYGHRFTEFKFNYCGDLDDSNLIHSATITRGSTSVVSIDPVSKIFYRRELQ